MLLLYLAYAGMLACATSAMLSFSRPHASDSWSRTKGRVVDVSFEGFVSLAPVRRYVSGGGSLQRYRVRYEYSVDGKTFAGDSVVSYQPTGRVRVYYNPLAPHLSALSTGRDLFPVVASCAVGFLIWIATFGIRASVKARAAA